MSNGEAIAFSPRLFPDISRPPATGRSNKSASAADLRSETSQISRPYALHLSVKKILRQRSNAKTCCGYPAAPLRCGFGADRSAIQKRKLCAVCSLRPACTSAVGQVCLLCHCLLFPVIELMSLLDQNFDMWACTPLSPRSPKFASRRVEAETDSDGAMLTDSAHLHETAVLHELDEKKRQPRPKDSTHENCGIRQTDWSTIRSRAYESGAVYASASCECYRGLTGLGINLTSGIA